LYARVRGIYSTAITKLLLERGIGITQPTKPIVERFEIQSPTYCPPDVTIKDLNDKRGVLVIGTPEAVKEVTQVLVGELQQIIVKEYKPLLYSIYKGVVKEITSDGRVVVDVGDGVGVLQETVFRLREGDELVVCVRRPSFDGFPKLSVQLVVSGKYVRFMKGVERVAMSEFIREPLKRKELLSLGFMVRPRGWGIRWRSSAKYASTEELLEEVERLKSKIEELEARVKEVNSPSLIEGGEAIVEVLFTPSSKRVLDKVRRLVIPTIDYHHYLKSIEGFSERVDFVEYLLSKGVRGEVLSKALLEYHIKTMIKRNIKDVTLYHSTIKGKVIRIHGVVHDVLKDGLVMMRRFSPSGYFDGISEAKERGDYGLTLVRLFKPYVIHFYYNREGVVKGIYFNVNTPVELVNVNSFRYIDLEIDVVKGSKGVRVIDRESFDEYVNRGVFSEKYTKEVLDLVKKVEEVLTKEELKSPLELDEKLSKTFSVNEALSW